MITLVVAPEVMPGGEAWVEGKAYRHLFRARRLAVGDALRVVDGRGTARWARVAAVGSDHGRLELGGEAPVYEPAVEVTLLVAPLRKERASWLVEKATELGVVAVRFVATERTPRRFGEGTLERFRRVATAALEQSHGARLPEISGVHRFEELPALLAAPPGRWALLADGDPAEAPAAGQPLSILVGPEGGWSTAERATLAEHGCRPVALGATTLRAETAAVVGAGLALVGWRD